MEIPLCTSPLAFDYLEHWALTSIQVTGGGTQSGSSLGVGGKTDCNCQALEFSVALSVSVFSFVKWANNMAYLIGGYED